MSSTGKIARLPKYIRDQLNQRLDDGQSANEILHWLNELPECQQMLAEKFGSHPITRQNLSQWKQGGYQTWLRVQQAREQLQSLFEYARDLESDDNGLLSADGMTFADRLGALVSVQLLSAIQKLDEITDPDQRWQRLTEIVSQLSRLRREDHHGRRVQLAEEQWSDKCNRQEKQDEKDAKEAKRIELRTWFWSIGGLKKDAEFLGGGEFGERWADWLRRLECDLPRPTWWRGSWINDARPEPFDAGHSPSSPKPADSVPHQERRSPTRRKSKNSKPERSLPRNKSNHEARNTTRRAEAQRRRKHETRDTCPSSPSSVSCLSPASPKLPGEGGPPPSCKVNQSKSNQPSANVPTVSTLSNENPSVPTPRDSKHTQPQTPAPSENCQPSNSNPSTPDPRPFPQ